MTEVWKQVVGFEGIYEVSDMGRVMRVAPGNGTWVGRVLRPTNVKGRLGVSLSRGGWVGVYMIAWLVCCVFHGSPPKYRCGSGRVMRMEVRHKDGDHNNNAQDNLMWGTKSENCADDVKYKNRSRGERNGSAKLTEAQVREIRASTGSNVEIAATYGISAPTVSSIRRRDSWAWLPEVRHRSRRRSYNPL